MIRTAARSARSLRGLSTRRASRLAPRVFAVLAVVGLLAPFAARVASSDTAGWLLGHGHIFLTVEAATHPHAHPWDRPDAVPTPGTPAGDPDVLFTFGDLDVASALAMLALPVFALLLAVSWRSEALALPAALARDVRARPLVPPPQR